VATIREIGTPSLPNWGFIYSTKNSPHSDWLEKDSVQITKIFTVLHVELIIFIK